MTADWEAMLREYGPQREAEPPPFEMCGNCYDCDKRPGDRWWPVDAIPGRWLCGGCWAAERGKDEEDPILGWSVNRDQPHYAFVEVWQIAGANQGMVGFATVIRLHGPGEPGYELLLGGSTLAADWPAFHAGVATGDEAITLAKRALARRHHGRAIGLPVIGLRPAKKA